MSFSTTNDQRETSIQLVNLHGGEIRLFEAYIRLTGGRREVEDLLLRHALLPLGLYSYVDWRDWNEVDRWSSWKLLMDKASEEMADAWYEWAFEISTMPMSRRARREAILKMVGHLVSYRFFEPDQYAGVHAEEGVAPTEG